MFLFSSFLYLYLFIYLFVYFGFVLFFVLVLVLVFWGLFLLLREALMTDASQCSLRVEKFPHIER